MRNAESSRFVPREPLLDPGLSRPNWLQSLPRSTEALWLDKNENLDPKLLSLTNEVLRGLDPMALCTYPECRGLYSKLAESLGIGAESLIFTAGSDGAIRATFEAFVEPGDKVLHTAPTFAMYFVYCKIYGAEEILLPYHASASGPKLDTSEVLSAIERHTPRLLCLPNPDSPTGTVFVPEDLRTIIRACDTVGTIVLIDEAYHPFYQPSVLNWVEEFQNLVVARTFAKAWGLAGLRFGYAATNRQIAEFLHKARPMYEVNTLAVVFMERMLDHAPSMLASVARLNAGKAYFLKAMDEFGFETLQGEGNFLHVAFGAQQDKIVHALSKRVLFRHDFSEPCLRGYSRFSSTTVDLFRPVIDIIADAVHSKG